jgi:hypothetical protein
MAKKIRTPAKQIDPELVTVINDLTTAATDAGNKIMSLRDQLSASPSPAEIADLKTKLTAIADGLKAVTVDPIPPAPPGP